MDSRKEEYRVLRVSVGTQETVAALLGVSVSALNRRESGRNGENEPTQEMFLALRFLERVNLDRTDGANRTDGVAPVRIV